MFNDRHDPIAAPTRPRRRRFWLWVVGLPLAVLVLLGVFWLTKVSSGLQGAIADADRLDPHWRLEDLEAHRATPPPGRNAADTVLAVKGLLPGNWPDYKLYELLNDLPRSARLNDQQVAAVRAMLQAAGPAVPKARSLIDTPSGRHAITFTPDWIGTLLPNVQETRRVATLLNLDALDHAQAGDPDGAVASAHAGLNAGSSIGDEPFLISQLVRIAVQAVAVGALERALAQGEPGEAALAAVQARVEAVELEPLLLYGLRGERAGGNLLFENIRTGNVPASNLGASIGGGAAPAYIALLLRIPGGLTVQHAGHLRFLNEMVEVAKLPPEEWAAPLAEMNAKVRNLPILARLLAPAVDKVAEACRRNRALLRATAAGLAAERFRRRTGRWPTSLEELVQAGLLRAVPTDPFTGRPMLFKRTADGLVIYAVGPDGQDDGGKLLRSGGQGTWDVGFQLWDVAARRGPPPPPKPPETPDGGDTPPPEP
jgi:hypothetical protein